MKKLVLTGGPCSGKTTVLAALREEFGEKLIYLPEAATILLGGGFPAPGNNLEWSPAWQTAFQAAVLPVQRGMEAAAELTLSASKAKLIVCDRGTLDGAAYTEGGLENFARKFGLEVGNELRRYSAVVHLESLAVTDPTRYGKTGNEHRFESCEEAAKLDAATRDAWSRHQRHMVVTGRRGIEGKVAEAVGIVKALLE